MRHRRGPQPAVAALALCILEDLASDRGETGADVYHPLLTHTHQSGLPANLRPSAT